MSITIDGPAGAGKSTIAKIIAKVKKLTYIDTGAMYRAVTLKFIQNFVDTKDAQQIEALLADIRIELIGDDIYLNGTNVTEEIRSPEVNQLVSEVAKLSPVRKKMVEFQRTIAAAQNVVMDGRDIGTFVLPDAAYKFFLTASIDERARRRFEEQRRKGFTTSLEDVKSEISNRDRIDTERELAPLIQAEDAILIDTTGLSIEKVVDKILSYIQ
ncbi:(d)CMP kinase [Geosporobacter ferrireducens]|uniref:Cytidylate kinase n=1 Tax=Geosporobacter ferrireducens TaxID=1424294 RepID=A0A1D8GPU3_9FIRM|nr:(d)CMP kinase [Geosporobacter ferrireducens]AOT72927.1 cytidylate kinase [Geosporobacter ferrireducens]AOT73349.1 cytidylate kinase [Geosporobacter ferrireducens]MTI55339.1 (d)CMP kinase [Geosporobacter ferrireducens]